MKQVIVVRKDLGMRKGKMVAQGSHASLGAYLDCSVADREEWMQTGQTKICLGIDSEEDLIQIFKDAYKADLPCYLVKDAGHTELPPGTLTAVCIGPAKIEDIDKITGKLKLL
jgi:peptidyl-tRNA hydrolase, PTH2 family